MKDWKDIITKMDRYKNFTILDKPKSLKELYNNKDIEYIQLHSVMQYDENIDDIVGFCGVIAWKNNKVIPLDGDSYSENINVLGYKWFISNGDHVLDILTDSY